MDSMFQKQPQLNASLQGGVVPLAADAEDPPTREVGSVTSYYIRSFLDLPRQINCVATVFLTLR
jgi:hypothetical protein